MLDNQKEIYIAHEELHKRAEEKWLSLLERYTKEELDCIQRFIKDVSNHLEN